MPKQYKQNDEEIGSFLAATIEKETQKEIFTMRVLDENDESDESDILRVLIVFIDRSVLLADIELETVGDKWAARIKGNYI